MCSSDLKPATLVSAGTVTATLVGSTIKPADKSLGILLIDAATGHPVSLQYGLSTTRSTNADGSVKSVTLTLKSKKPLPHAVRVYLMVDTYPAAKGNLQL